MLCHAQYSDSVHHYAGLVSTGTYNKTTTNSSFVLSNMLKLGIRQKAYACNGNVSWLYGQQQGNLTNNDVVATADINLYKTFPNFYYWGLANYTSSFSLKIIDQYQAGAGIAYNILDTKNAYLNVSDGIIYENSNIILADSTDKYSTYRNSFRLSFRFVIKDMVTISSMSFYQNSFNSSTDYIIRSNATLGVKVRKWLSLNTTYTYNRFNRTGRENTLLNYGLTVEKYF
ncbi:hypothetical protein GCM10023093_02950 [Nemorincola caseinilytica]|uniref:DUF481 domain-containing protein n=2 Tax=Nemorincola caseinilytica TaxID=2054315 RepID=A0ABP8N602_9BACT